MQAADKNHADAPTAKATLHQAILAAFNADDPNQEAAASVLTGLTAAFSEVLSSDLLAELRKQTTLLEVIAKQGERQLRYINEVSNPIRTADFGGLPG